MPYYFADNPSRAKYCRKRLASPKLFHPKSFRVIELSRKKGVKGIIGCPKKHFHSGKCAVGTRLQSMLYPVGHNKCPRPGLELNPKDVGKEKKIRDVMNVMVKSGRLVMEDLHDLYYDLSELSMEELDRLYRKYSRKRRSNPYLDNTHLKERGRGAQILYILSVYEKLGWSDEDLMDLAITLGDMSDSVVYKVYRGAEKEAKKLKSNPGERYHSRKFMEYLRGLGKWKVGSPGYIRDLAKAYEHLESANESMKQGID